MIFLKDGYDPIVANSNGVLVEVKPAAARGGIGNNFQEFFEEKLKTDPDMALHSDPQTASGVW